MDLVALQNTLDNGAFAILLVTTLLYWAGVAFPKVPGLAVLSTAGLAIGNLCIAGLLGARWLEAGYFPISNLYESLFFLAWGLTTFALFAERMGESRLVGAVTAPVVMCIAAFATLTLPVGMQVSAPLVPALKSNWLMMHVSVMMLSYAALMVGSLLAIAFLVVSRGQPIHLKGSSVGTGGFREGRLNHTAAQTDPLPGGASFSSASGGTAVLTPVAAKEAPTLSIQRLTLAETLDNLSYRVIGLGFPLLTIGIISGAVWANEAWGAPWSWDPKETWALITWLVFAAYLHARITRGWQGRRPAMLATAGLGVVWVCYLGVNLLGKGLHSYGWFF
ncbi:c-type cytochrome biogenesis protein CcsB [Synechococcales cyanobacterium C]|uniref:Cytochrome c biogenesis protein CcsA n=1 Tax=Petrachloros mirabilis ULC683 TaxID=2781853 RepID=A0A8K1ZZL1_9CYAN|nr:c-type cytochrome biogenesis protein CcsB [Petrachloros mirabilis]NCJ07021.1 c-type cytochrome biogenesis protein CcsB [Petrachloros mirabilis ULC683]